MIKIGAYEAKTHLSQLLERVEAGESIAITRHGQDVARLIPATPTSKTSLAEMAANWKETRKKVKLRGLNARALIEQGRR
jgi:prevent-host-death family protein